MFISKRKGKLKNDIDLFRNAPPQVKKWIEAKAAEAEAAEEEKKILHFTALEDGGAGISLNAVDRYGRGGPDPISLECKVNNGEWSSWDLSEVQLQKDDVMYVRAVDENKTFSKDSSSFYQFSMSGGKVAAEGSVQYLLKKDGDIDSVPKLGFNSLFYGCSSLTQAPELPAKTLAGSCYNCMFYGCSSLTQAPELPATTLTSNCYYDMFNGCTSLTQAPALPATTLADYCYSYMFRNCSSLTQAPALPATTLAEGCYYGMFDSCSSLTQAPALPATTLADWCYYDMFYSCDKFSEVHMPVSMDGIYDTSTHGDTTKTVVYDL